MHLNLVETYRCRPCVKDFVEAGLASVRRCPQCGGPLLSLTQMQKHEKEAQEALGRLRRQSAVTMTASALLMVVMQAILSFLQSAEVAGYFNWLVFGVASASIVAAALWMFTAKKIWMLCGAILLQTAAAVFFFVVMGVVRPFFMPGMVKMIVAALPMAGALLAWHQFRAYCQLLRLEQTKGKGCRVG